MTSREIRRERREAERKAKKLERKEALLKTLPPTHEPGRFNPELEDEFSSEFLAHVSAVRDRIHRSAGIAPSTRAGFVSHNSSNGTASMSEPVGFVSHRAEINRQNAQHSTGPRSSQGKLASSRNSLKHGLSTGHLIIPGEDPAAFESLRNDLIEEHQPANPTEELLLNEMAQSYWLEQRAIRLQNECFTANGVDEKRLSLFLRYQTTYNRGFHKALNTLLRLKQSARKQASLNPGLVSQTAASPRSEDEFVRQNDASPGTEIGFVSQNNTSSVAEAA